MKIIPKLVNEDKNEYAITCPGCKNTIVAKKEEFEKAGYFGEGLPIDLICENCRNKIIVIGRCIDLDLRKMLTS